MVKGYLAMPKTISGLDKCQQPCLCMQRGFCLRTQAVSARDVPVLIPPFTWVQCPSLQHDFARQTVA